MQKKVLFINGSPKINGNTAIALNEVAILLKKCGLYTETVHLGTQQIRGCIACNTCTRQGDGKCVFDDDIANQISHKANQFDAFVIGSPVYYSQPSGQLVCLIQRMLYSNAEAFLGKPVANVAVCRRGGATAALQSMNMPWMMNSCPIITSQYWNIAYGREPGDVACDAEGMQTMRTLACNMAQILGCTTLPLKEEKISTHFVRKDLL